MTIKRMTMSLGIKKWFNRNKTKVSYENVICKNCETHFSGKFCPECGQSVKDYDKPFTFIFYNFAGDFFSFDTRFFRTFLALLIKPGFLTKQYFLGKRVKYAPPFRIFIFMSFVLFLLLQIYTNKGLTTVLDSNFSEGKHGLDSTSMAVADSIIKETKAEMDSTELAVADSIFVQFGSIFDSAKSEDINFGIDKEIFSETKDVRQVLNQLAVVLEQKLETEENPKKQAKFREYIKLCRSPEQAVARILEYMSWAFFLLLPIFAVVLKLVYIRRKQNYMRHLVFSIHIHSFVFFVLTLVVGQHLIFKGNIEILTIALILLIPVYFMIALKKFYGQSIGKVFLKSITVSFLYNTIFWMVVVFVFLNALSII